MVLSFVAVVACNTARRHGASPGLGLGWVFWKEVRRGFMTGRDGV